MAGVHQRQAPPKRRALAPVRAFRLRLLEADDERLVRHLFALTGVEPLKCGLEPLGLTQRAELIELRRLQREAGDGS